MKRSINFIILSLTIILCSKLNGANFSQKETIDESACNTIKTNLQKIQDQVTNEMNKTQAQQAASSAFGLYLNSSKKAVNAFNTYKQQCLPPQGQTYQQWKSSMSDQQISDLLNKCYAPNTGLVAQLKNAAIDMGNKQEALLQAYATLFAGDGSLSKYNNAFTSFTEGQTVSTQWGVKFVTFQQPLDWKSLYQTVVQYNNDQAQQIASNNQTIKDLTAQINNAQGACGQKSVTTFESVMNGLGPFMNLFFLAQMAHGLGGSLKGAAMAIKDKITQATEVPADVPISSEIETDLEAGGKAPTESTETPEEQQEEEEAEEAESDIDTADISQITTETSAGQASVSAETSATTQATTSLEEAKAATAKTEEETKTGEPTGDEGTAAEEAEEGLSMVRA